MRQFNDQWSQILWWHTFLFLSICQSCSYISSLLYIVSVQLRYLNVRTGFWFSNLPEPPSVIQMVWLLPISGALGTRIAKEFRISGNSSMLSNLHPIAQENRYPHLDSPGTDQSHYMSQCPGEARLSKRYCELMYHILRHSSGIPGIPEEYSQVFPLPDMRFRYTSDPLSCRVG